MGGWYLQPTAICQTASPLSAIYRKDTGFLKKSLAFRPTTAINFDSFGHSVGLVQILNQAGYDTYVVCRPAKAQFPFKEQDYLWKGLAGFGGFGASFR